MLSLIFHENSDFVSTKRFQRSISNEKSRSFCKALRKFFDFFRSERPLRSVSSRRNRCFYNFWAHWKVPEGPLVALRLLGSQMFILKRKWSTPWPPVEKQIFLDFLDFHGFSLICCDFSIFNDFLRFSFKFLSNFADFLNFFLKFLDFL